MSVDVIIIGAGLSGLTTAYELKKAGVSFRILEARDRCGGRILTLFGQPPVEMGATWFGQKHIHLQALLEELGISSFLQRTQGVSLMDPGQNIPLHQFQIPENEESSFRISGGSSYLIKTLVRKVGEENIQLSTPVESIDISERVSKVTSKMGQMFKSKIVISTLPPKLFVNTIEIRPQLPESVHEVCENTHTWMHDSIKFAIRFENPFWRESGFSGVLYSNVGPIVEMYDHSSEADDSHSLMGFLHPNLHHWSQEKRSQAAIEQLSKFFGPKTQDFIDYEDRVWLNDTMTSDTDTRYLTPHQNSGHPIYQEKLFEGRLIISGSETAPSFGGYMDGAVEAGKLASS